jgi:hypothetical protein
VLVSLDVDGEQSPRFLGRNRLSLDPKAIGERDRRWRVVEPHDHQSLPSFERSSDFKLDPVRSLAIRRPEKHQMRAGDDRRSNFWCQLITRDEVSSIQPRPEATAPELVANARSCWSRAAVTV